MQTIHAEFHTADNHFRGEGKKTKTKRRYKRRRVVAEMFIP